MPGGDRWALQEVLDRQNILRMPKGYRRHQMAGGSLCLVEADTHDRQEVTSGAAVLHRAKEVFRAVALGRPFPFPDTQLAEMEEHFESVLGDIIIGESFYDERLVGGGRYFAVETFDAYDTMPSYVPQSTEIRRRLWVGTHITATGSANRVVESVWS